ncbi:flagellin [Verrucomicrobia bacterium]|nr:flagellin [Verrucomicrobiota bacterium]
MVIIGSNISSGNAARHLGESTQALQKSLARLSSGSKLNNASDDAAGAAVSLKLDSQITRLGAARSNVGNAISLTQAQDGYLKKVGTALERMGELSLLAQDTTKSDTDKALYNTEYTKLGAFIDDIETKEFNGVAMFGASTGLDVTVGENAGDTAYSMADIDLTGDYATATALTLSDAASGVTAQAAVEAAITQLATDRAAVGADQSALQSYSSTLSVLQDNLSAANSRIKDVDVAEESANFARQNILVQSGTAMLAQANALPQSALRLIG